MIILATASRRVLGEFEHPNLGQLVTPRQAGGVEQTAEDGWTWAADNGAFLRFEMDRYNALLDRISGLPGCKFVSCPDAVGNAPETARLFRRWAPGLARRGLPIAYVLQDGVQVRQVPWREIDAVFIGGTDAFKGSPAVAGLAYCAKCEDKWVHMGRVNGLQRIRYAGSIGVDSIDGWGFSGRFRDRDLPPALAWVSAPKQMPLREEMT